MPDRNHEILTDEEAARLWQRAAQLQADAAASGAALADPSATQPEGHALAHVRAAAVEAGIGREFVDAALAEVRLERSLPAPTGNRSLARRVVPDLPDSITIGRSIPAAAPEVLSAMEAVLPGPPYRLTLTDRQGDPLDRGTMVFDIHGSSNPFESGFGSIMNELGIRQLHISLRPGAEPAQSTEVIVHGRVTAHTAGVMIAGIFAGLAGVVSTGAFLAVGFGTGIGPLLGIPGALLGGWLGLKAHRAVIRYAVRRARQSLEGLAGAVAARARGGWGAR